MSDDWKSDCISKVMKRNEREVYPFNRIFFAVRKLQFDNEIFERKLIDVMRKISVLRHDNTQALSDIMLTLPTQTSTATSINTNDEVFNILIQTLELTRSQLSIIMNELRSVNSDIDGQEKNQRIVLHERIREQQHIINQQNDELKLAKEEIKRILERNVELEKS